MTLKSDTEWLDDFFADEPQEEQCTVHQLAIIDGLMRTSAASFMYMYTNFEQMTYQEAQTCIQILMFNDRPIDPREQFKRFNF